MTLSASERVRRRLIALLPVLLLAGLVALQVQQAFTRIGVLRDRQRVQFLNAVERMNAEVASAVAGDFALRAAKLDVLVELPAIGAALREEEAGRLLGVGAAGDSEGGEVRLVPQVTERGTRWRSDLNALEFYAPLRAPEAGGVVLTVKGESLFARVSQFQPIEGVANALVDPNGALVAVDAVGRDLGLAPGQALHERYPATVVAEVLAGGPRVRTGGARLFVAQAGESDRAASRAASTAARFLLVSVVPDAALTEKAAPAEREARAVVLVTLLSTLGLIVAGLLLHRASVRERALRERSRELERERELAERLSTGERLSALGLLTAGVAHEINNPLEGIGNYLSLLKSKDLPEDKRAVFVGRVEHGFERIRKIVRELLGFARPGTQSGIFDLRTAVRQALDLARLTPVVKSCELVESGIDAHDGALLEPALAQGDAGSIEQVVLNLVLNAASATEGSGTIEVSLVREGGEHVLLVQDDGPGVAQEDLHRIFDPFFSKPSRSKSASSPGAQGSSPENGGPAFTTEASEDASRLDSAAEGGTGLGLSISYSIVQTHGGSIAATNRTSGGARFEVRLPVVSPSADAAANANRGAEEHSA